MSDQPRIAVMGTGESARVPQGPAGHLWLSPSALIHEPDADARTSGRQPRRTTGAVGTVYHHFWTRHSAALLGKDDADGS